MKLLNKDALILRLHIGDITEDKSNVPIEAISVTNNHEPIIEFKDGSKVIFDWNELCEAARNFKIQHDLENKGGKG
jgi:hypothetical protein